MLMSKMLATSRKIVIRIGGIQPPGTQFVPGNQFLLGTELIPTIIATRVYLTGVHFSVKHEVRFVENISGR